jgi:hypothetical protein
VQGISVQRFMSLIGESFAVSDLEHERQECVRVRTST